MDLRRTFSLNKVADPRKLLLLYQGVVEPMLLYGMFHMEQCFSVRLVPYHALLSSASLLRFSNAFFPYLLCLPILLPIELRALEIAASFVMKLNHPRTKQYASIVNYPTSLSYRYSSYVLSFSLPPVDP